MTTALASHRQEHIGMGLQIDNGSYRLSLTDTGGTLLLALDAADGAASVAIHLDRHEAGAAAQMLTRFSLSRQPVDVDLAEAHKIVAEHYSRASDETIVGAVKRGIARGREMGRRTSCSHDGLRDIRAPRTTATNHE